MMRKVMKSDKIILFLVAQWGNFRASWQITGKVIQHCVFCSFVFHSPANAEAHLRANKQHSNKRQLELRPARNKSGQQSQNLSACHFQLGAMCDVWCELWAVPTQKHPLYIIRTVHLGFAGEQSLFTLPVFSRASHVCFLGGFFSLSLVVLSGGRLQPWGLAAGLPDRQTATCCEDNQPVAQAQPERGREGRCAVH